MVELLDLNEDEKATLEAEMAQAYKVFCKEARRCFGDCTPSFIRRLRAPDATKNPKVLGWIARLNDLAPRIVGGYFRVVRELCNSFDATGEHRVGVTWDDYGQEAQIAIWEAAFTYNGTRRFSTYIYWVVKHRLIDFCRDEELQVGVVHEVRRLRKQVRMLMQEGLSFDEAIYAIEVNTEISPHALRTLQNKQSSPDDVESHYRDEKEVSLVHAAIDKAPLTDLEKGLIMAFMQGDRHYRSSVKVKNPVTGKPYTRQGLRLMFNSACEKVRAVYVASKVA